MNSTTDDILLEVRDLHVAYSRGAPVLAGVDLQLHRGASAALVGPSGCGKSTLALALTGLLPPEARISAGSIRLHGAAENVELVAADARAWHRVRGSRIAMIFQSPGAALNPVVRVGRQIAEAVRLHTPGSRRAAMQRAIELLADVELAPDTARAFPHELSGGMQQRALIAVALAGKPQLLIADEPTSALDVTVQAQVLELLARLRRSTGMALLLITHDIAVASSVAETIHVLDAGCIVEHGPTREVLAHPQHSQTQALVADARTLTLETGAVP